MIKIYLKKIINFQKSNLLCVTRYMLRDKKGTSFLEIIIYVAIISMLITTFISFSLYINNSYSKTFTVQEVNSNTRSALNLISQRVRAAKSINVSESIFDINPGVLSLEMNNPLINPIVFSINSLDQSLYMAEGSGAPMKVTDQYVKVTNLVFSYLTDRDIESISLNMTIDYPGASKEFQHSNQVSTTITLR